MKRIQSLISGLVVCGVALAMSANASAQTMTQDATVLKIQGAAQYSVGNNVWQTLRLGQKLRPGTTIRTATGSYVDLLLGERAGALHEVRPMGAGQPGQISFQARVQQDIVRIWESS